MRLRYESICYLSLYFCGVVGAFTSNMQLEDVVSTAIMAAKEPAGAPKSISDFPYSRDHVIGRLHMITMLFEAATNPVIQWRIWPVLWCYLFQWRFTVPSGPVCRPCLTLRNTLQAVRKRYYYSGSHHRCQYYLVPSALSNLIVAICDRG
jgi:hypothetical protein